MERLERLVLGCLVLAGLALVFDKDVAQYIFTATTLLLAGMAEVVRAIERGAD